MGKKGMGEGLDSILKPTAKRKAAPAAEQNFTAKPQGRGRPKQFDVPPEKVTVTMTITQIVYLDRLSASIKERAGRSVNRASIIRSIIDALMASSIDLTNTSSSEDIKALLIAKFEK